MRKALLLAGLLVCIPTCVWGQEQNVVSEVIIVTGHRPDDLPPSYRVGPPQESLLVEEGYGRRDYAYTRRLMDFGDGRRLEWRQTWSADAPGLDVGAPERRESRRLRLVCELPLSTCLGFDN